MEKIKDFIKDSKKTVLISLVASIFIILLSLKYRTYSILQLIISLVPTILFIIYYSNVTLKLYANKGNVMLARNILFITYTIYSVLGVIFFSILTSVFHIFIAIYLYFILYKKSTKINNNIFAIVILAFYIYSFVTSLQLGYFSTITLINYILNILSYLYFYSYYEGLKEVCMESNDKKVENKNNLESIGIETKKVEEIDKETRQKIYEVFCKEIKATLKAPSTAVFCKEEELTITEEYGMYLVTGWVDSQNSYGAMVRTYYNKFKIENENGFFVARSNARTIASNKLAGTLAGYWIYGIISTIVTGAIFYFIISSTM